MSNTKDDTAPQTRLCPAATLKFLNFNRRMPVLSAVKDVRGELHQLILGTESTTLIDATHLTHAEIEDVSAAIGLVKTQIQEFQTASEMLFNVKSDANPILVVQLPDKISLELEAMILTQINYKMPTIYVPANIKSTFKLQGRMIVLPEMQIKPDLQSPQVVNWDALVRITKYLDVYEGWANLHKVTPVGRFSIPYADKSLIKMDIE